MTYDEIIEKVLKEEDWYNDLPNNKNIQMSKEVLVKGVSKAIKKALSLQKQENEKDINTFKHILDKDFQAKLIEEQRKIIKSRDETLASLQEKIERRLLGHSNVKEQKQIIDEIFKEMGK